MYMLRMVVVMSMLLSVFFCCATGSPYHRRAVKNSAAQKRKHAEGGVRRVRLEPIIPAGVQNFESPCYKCFKCGACACEGMCCCAERCCEGLGIVKAKRIQQLKRQLVPVCLRMERSGGSSSASADDDTPARGDCCDPCCGLCFKYCIFSCEFVFDRLREILPRQSDKFSDSQDY